MALDLHKRPFDEGTIVKLSLYKNYIQEWLPVFIRSDSQFRAINIFDFFCGPGEDEQGHKGSPLITLEILNNYIGQLKKYNVSISLFFNDKRKRKVLTHLCRLN